MPCRVYCESTVVSQSTDCIDLSGDGSTGTPLQANPILAPTVTGQGPTPGPLCNGITCGPDGLEVQPDRVLYVGIGGGASASLPVILTDQAGAGPGGSATWGARVDIQTVQLDPCRGSLAYSLRTFPGINYVLEPGATVELYLETYSTGINAAQGTLAPFLSVQQWQFENNGPALQTYVTPPFNDENPVTLFPAGSAVGDFIWVGYQVWIRTTGFTGPSSVSSYLGGAGMNAFIWGLPL
jgi:hypothetical protein